MEGGGGPQQQQQRRGSRASPRPKSSSRRRRDSHALGQHGREHCYCLQTRFVFTKLYTKVVTDESIVFV